MNINMVFFEKFQPRYMLPHRIIVNICLVILNLLQIFLPTPYRIIALIIGLVAIAIQSLLYGHKYYTRIKNSWNKRSTKKRTYSLDELDDKTKKIVFRWLSELNKKYRIVVTSKVENFQARSVTDTISVNPDALKTSDPRDSEASFYHELGHLLDSRRFFLEMMLITFVLTIYSFSIVFDSARNGIPVISLFATAGIFFLLNTWISWRREYRADKFASKKVGLEYMKIMFDGMPYRYNVESHPSPEKRWKKLNQE